MPNVWTHILFAENLLDKSGYETEDGEGAVFRLGAQGPDPFFYHHFWPWDKGKGAAVIGDVIHHQKCGPFLLDMIDYGKERKDVRTYILGFLTHHILDRNTHPYIIYRSGNEGNKHQKLEVIIDTLLMKEYRGIHTWKTPVYREIDAGPHLPDGIEKMLSDLIKKHFPEHDQEMESGYIDQSYRDMKKALRVLYDPIGWKNKLLRKQVSPFSYEKRIPDKDFLNRNKTEWRHPALESEISTDSFDELVEVAESEGEKLLKLVVQYWKNPVSERKEQLVDLIGNRSYDTGRELSLQLTNKYFDPIL